MGDRKLVLGIGMRGEPVSKVGEGHAGRKMEMEKRGRIDLKCYFENSTLLISPESQRMESSVFRPTSMESNYRLQLSINTAPGVFLSSSDTMENLEHLGSGRTWITLGGK